MSVLGPHIFLVIIINIIIIIKYTRGMVGVKL